jgi:uncharacterized protein (UPF0332 family)
MDRIDHLFMKAQKYLRSAALLFEMEDFDSCASRAYFAMFYAAQACLMADVGSIPARQSIRSAFLQRFVDTGRLPRHAGEALREAADLQELGDYAHDFAIESAAAERILQEAEAFVNSLARLTSQHA